MTIVVALPWPTRTRSRSGGPPDRPASVLSERAFAVECSVLRRPRDHATAGR
jgi:hypothetical protein